MEDKVGSHNPAQKHIDKWVTAVKQLTHELAPHTVTLSNEEIKHVLKARPNGDSILPLLIELAQRYKIEIPGISVPGLLADQALSISLKPLEAALTELAERVAHTRLEADSEKWWAATGYYSALQGLSRSNPELQIAMRPLVDFFATGRRAAPKPAL